MKNVSQLRSAWFMLMGSLIWRKLSLIQSEITRFFLLGECSLISEKKELNHLFKLSFFTLFASPLE